MGKVYNHTCIFNTTNKSQIRDLHNFMLLFKISLTFITLTLHLYLLRSQSHTTILKKNVFLFVHYCSKVWGQHFVLERNAFQQGCIKLIKSKKQQLTFLKEYWKTYITKISNSIMWFIISIIQRNVSWATNYIRMI